MNEQGFDADVISGISSYWQERSTKYLRTNYLERRKPIMQWWSDYIEKAATGNMSMTGKKGLKLVNAQ